MSEKEKRQQMPDVSAVNPRYAGMRWSDAARILTRPKDPRARETLARRQGRAGATPPCRSSRPSR